ncbi:MAG: FAD-dependent oxidoreductase, partial [Deltaproteobacteria bacterium]|nr:FAD-dependent oxidoreductase [Deltaproteobacteria bacterium]
MSLHQSGKNERYNLVVIGAGAAGLTVAAGAAGLGARVALVERGAMGGDCLNYGCVPSKALLAAAAAAHQTRRFLAAAGVPAPSALHRDAQWSRATAQVRAAIAAIAPHDSEARFRSLGVEVFAGHGRWVGGKAGGPHVEVISEGGASRILHTRSVVLATGSRPLIPPIPGLTEAGFLTNETLFDLPQLPARIAVLGGGPVGVELAQALTRLGAQVHLVEKMPWLLPREDPDATAVLADALCAEGVILHLGKTVVRVAGDGAERRLELEPAAGLAPGESREVLKVDQVLVAVGRQPNSEGLGLECAADRGDSAAGGFIPVDTRMRTRHRGVFACGDVAGPHLFTHTA